MIILLLELMGRSSHMDSIEYTYNLSRQTNKLVKNVSLSLPTTSSFRSNRKTGIEEEWDKPQSMSQCEGWPLVCGHHSSKEPLELNDLSKYYKSPSQTCKVYSNGHYVPHSKGKHKVKYARINKFIDTKLRQSRSGIIVYTRVNGELMFGLAVHNEYRVPRKVPEELPREVSEVLPRKIPEVLPRKVPSTETGTLTDFGGKVERRRNESPIVAAMREFKEESLGVFKEYLPKDSNCMAVRNKDLMIMFWQLDLDQSKIDAINKAFIEKLKIRKDIGMRVEVKSITWLSLKALQSYTELPLYWKTGVLLAPVINDKVFLKELES